MAQEIRLLFRLDTMSAFSDSRLYVWIINEIINYIKWLKW